jgi:hypothetical protein
MVRHDVLHTRMVANEVEDKPDVHSYPYGSRGPEGLEEFTSKHGHYKRFDDD